MKKHWLYFKYLMRHKYFVFVAGRKTGVSLWRLIIHDWSKFLPCEWLPYVRNFYGDYNWYTLVDSTLKYQPGFTGRGMAQVRAEFDRAWLHHQHANPHHWQHWNLREDSGALKLLEMPSHFAREMVADWMGAGRAITGKWEAAAWYESNRSKIKLEKGTRSFVEALLYAHANLREYREI